jgi:hypothetical protein
MHKSGGFQRRYSHIIMSKISISTVISLPIIVSLLSALPKSVSHLMNCNERKLARLDTLMEQDLYLHMVKKGTVSSAKREAVKVIQIILISIFAL